MNFDEISGSEPKQQSNKNFNQIALYFDIHQCHLRREMAAFTKSLTNNKKQHTSFKLLLKLTRKLQKRFRTFIVNFELCKLLASLYSSFFASSSTIQNSGKFDLRTPRINLVRYNTEIIKIGILLCLKRR